MGLPHRNYSAFKQADPNKRQVKERIRMDPRFSARVTKAAGRLKPQLAKRRALFPEGRGLGVGGRKKKEKRKQKRKARGEHQRMDIYRSIRKDGSNQTVNFPKQNIILILADDVGGILIRPHSMWFVDYLDCS